MTRGPHQQLDASNLRELARGCSLLGAGGGGDAKLGLLMALQAVEEHGPVDLVALGDLPADACVMPCGLVGSPGISDERIWSGDEGGQLRAVVEQLGHGRVAALMCFEIAGANGLLPVTWAARAGLPLADADGMGRAFPRLEQQAMGLDGVTASPVVLSDGRGSTVVIDGAGDPQAGRLARGAAARLGGVCAAALYSMSVGRARAAAIDGSVSRALALGRAMEASGRDGWLAALCGELEATVLVEGNVVDLRRGAGEDLIRGSVTVQAQGDGGTRLVRVELQNEYLLALEDGAVLASVPDVICVLSTETAHPVPPHRIGFGEPVVVTAWAGPEVWRSARGLPVAGPAAFGYDIAYAPLGHDGR